MFGISVCYDLIPTFPVCYLEVLQAEALQSKQEKQESNRKKRAAQQQAAQLKKQVVKLQVKALQPSLVEAQESDEDAQIHTWALRSKQRNRGVTAHFEQHVRCALATGATARQVTDMLRLDASYLLEPDQASIFIHDLPQLRWVQTQREGLGIESYLYSFMRIAGASRVLQWGFDETSLDGTPTLNQWVLIEEGMSSPTVVTIECCGLLVGSTSEEIADHIHASWPTGTHLLTFAHINAESSCTLLFL